MQEKAGTDSLEGYDVFIAGMIGKHLKKSQNQLNFRGLILHWKRVVNFICLMLF